MLLISLGMLLAVSLASVPDTVKQILTPQSRTAQWIWQVQDGPQNTWLSFRKRIVIEKLSGKIMARIAASSRYWLYINGTPVIRDGGQKRGPSRKDTYVDEVDLTRFFSEGENTIAVMVWDWGKSCFSHVDSGKGGLFFDADL